MAYPTDLLDYGQKYVEYGMVERFFLKNITSGALLFNEQEANYGDENYAPYNDYGSFFTAVDYAYNAHIFNETEVLEDQSTGSTDPSILTNIIDSTLVVFDAVDLFFGISDKIEKTVDLFDLIYSFATNVNDWITLFGDEDIEENAVEPELVSESKLITAECFNPNRDEQLKHYKDEEGNPYMIKEAIVSFKQDKENYLLYCGGDRFTAQFTVSHSALNGRQPNYTRFVNKLALCVVDGQSQEPIASDSIVIQKHMMEPVVKQINMEQIGNVYMLPEGEDHIELTTVPYESDYTVEVHLSEKANVTVNGQNKFGKDLSFLVNAEQGESISIDFNGNEIWLDGTIIITPNDSLSIQSISANGRYIFKTDDLNGVKQLQTGNKNLIIEGIFTYDDYIFTEHEGNVQFEPSTKIVDWFNEGEEYYIILHNTSSSNVNNVELKIEELTSLTLDKKTQVDSSAIAMSFTNPYGTEMNFRFTLADNNDATVYDNDGTLALFSKIVDGADITYTFALAGNEEGYVFFDLSESVSILIFADPDADPNPDPDPNVNPNYLKWEINDQIIDSTREELKRGETYKIRLLYCEDEDKPYEVKTMYELLERNAEICSFSNNELTITYAAPFVYGDSDLYEIVLQPTNYPNVKLHIELVAGKEDIPYTVTLNRNGGSGGDSLIEAHYNRQLPIGIQAPSRTDYAFMGYYSSASGGTMYYDEDMNPVRVWERESDGTLYAHWERVYFNIYLDKDGGTGGTTSFKLRVGEKWPNITMPTKLGYTPKGYYYDKGTVAYPIYYYNGTYVTNNPYFDTVFNESQDIYLYCLWEPKLYYFVIDKMHWEADSAVVMDSPILTYFDTYSCTAPETYTLQEVDSYGNIISSDTRKFECWRMIYEPQNYDPTTNPWIDWPSKSELKLELNFDVADVITNYYPDYEPGYGNIHFRAVYNEYVSQGCVSEGTLITLADGSQKSVELLTGNEMLLVWNMYTGTFGSAPILCIDSDPLSMYEVIQLSFSDGTKVDVISEHGFFDVDLNRYVYLDNSAADYIGHHFLKQGINGMVHVTLVDVTITQERTTVYSPVTYGHLCYYVNGMLSMPGGIDGLFNIFEVNGETMMYDTEAMVADIEQYGLYTYEELSALVPVTEEMFEAVNAQYLKVAVGKGMITVEQIGELIERYGNMFS